MEESICGTTCNLEMSSIYTPDIPVRNLDGTYGAGSCISVSGGGIDLISISFLPPNPIGLASLITNSQTVRTV
ncbi:MAG: hypothetical protein QM734_11960 [Cyclobacteriaceae bacterium]